MVMQEVELLILIVHVSNMGVQYKQSSIKAIQLVRYIHTLCSTNMYVCMYVHNVHVATFMVH